MSVVVCDASPLIALAFLGQLDFLQTAFREIWVPPTVIREAARPRLNFPGADLSHKRWIIAESPISTRYVETRFPELDRGEIEAVSLAMERRSELLIIDEAAGRSAASALGLEITGTMGLLLRAKSAGVCSTIKPLIDRLRHELNFFISADLYQSTLKRAAE